MAIPLGTTSRQIEAVARWTLTGVVALGMVAWWWPGYRSWGAVAVGLLSVLVLWLAWQTVRGERRVPGHPLHLALLVPAGVLVGHFVRVGLGPHGGEWAPAGGVDISMVFHLALMALGVMLAQSLLPAAARHVGVLGLCGAAMMSGPAAAMIWGRTQPVRTALALLGFAGVGVWLTMLWGMAAGAAGPGGRGRLRNRVLRGGCVVVAASASVGLSISAPLQGLLAAGVLAATLFLAGIAFPRRRALLLAVGGGMGVGVVVVLSAVRWVREALVGVLVPLGQAPPFGRGEEAFRDVSAADSGLAVLTAVVGWAGTAAFVLCLVGCLVGLLLHARKGGPGDQGRAILWTAASGMVAGAVLAPGGLFLPAALLAGAFVWGLLPGMLGRPERRRSGAVVLVAVGGTVALQAVASEPGLLGWLCRIFGAGDGVLHASMGFLAAMLAAWLLGARRAWLGLAGIALAALAGGPAEALQQLISTRTGELRDWLHHSLGCAVAVVPYLLCVGARWCESPDAVAARPDAADAYVGPQGHGR